jgi:hypothetical protein
MTLGTYILKGRKPVAVDMDTWGFWFGKHNDERIVGRWTFGEIEVSTMFLGIDHGDGDGPPILFETMIFGGPWGGQMRRYSTWDEAERGHMRVCKAVRRRARKMS